MITAKYGVFYDSANHVILKAAAHLPAPSARLNEFHGRGTLLMGGAFANPQDDGAMQFSP